MARYVSRPKAAKAYDDSDWFEPPLLTNIDVTDIDPVDTGLLDEHGNTIWRVSDPIGFVHYD